MFILFPIAVFFLSSLSPLVLMSSVLSLIEQRSSLAATFSDYSTNSNFFSGFRKIFWR